MRALTTGAQRLFHRLRHHRCRHATRLQVRAHRATRPPRPRQGTGARFAEARIIDRPKRLHIRNDGGNVGCGGGDVLRHQRRFHAFRLRTAAPALQHTAQHTFHARDGGGKARDMGQSRRTQRRTVGRGTCRGGTTRLARHAPGVTWGLAPGGRVGVCHGLHCAIPSPPKAICYGNPPSRGAIHILTYTHTRYAAVDHNLPPLPHHITHAR